MKQGKCTRLQLGALDAELTRSFSIAEIVACGMPVAADSWLWVSSCSSRTIHNDSPAVSWTRGRAGLAMLRRRLNSLTAVRAAS